MASPGLSVDTTISDTERDALLEAFNVGIGSAAASFSQMVGQEVLLSLPTLKVLTRDELLEQMPSKPSTVCGVGQNFACSAGNGQALVFFPEAGSLQLVQVLVGGDHELGEMAELEQEALTEVGNVVLNACLAGLSNLVQEEFDVKLPSFMRCNPRDMMSSDSESNVAVALLDIRFDLKQQELNGHLAFLLGITSLHRLAKSLLASMGLGA